MSWNVAQAKQRFSELVRRAAEEPQLIFNRGRLVAAMVDAEDFEAFRQWKAHSQPRTPDDELAELHQPMAEEDYILKAPARSTRANPFDNRAEPMDHEFSA